MNFLSIIFIGYILVASLLVYFFYRDQKNRKTFLGRNRIITWFAILVLVAGIIFSVDARFVEPFVLVISKQKIVNSKLINPVRIAFVSDIQAGNHKKEAWVEKIVRKIEKINPDIVILGGDLIDNEGTDESEVKALSPLRQLVGKYPIYYIMGNHEHGIGGKVRTKSSYWTADRSNELAEEMRKYNIPLLKDSLSCPQIKGQKICLYGIDDIWYQTPSFAVLSNSTSTLPLIFVSHNPDGILYWPKELKKPDLVLSGHTHGGQVWIPFIGPLANPGVEMGEKYFRGLNYYQDIPILTSVGAGESGGPVRLFTLPEVVEIEIIPSLSFP